MSHSPSPNEATLEELERELGSQLEALHAPANAGGAPVDMERALLARFDEVHDAPRSPRRAWVRLASAAAVAMCVVGACAVPATYDVSMGLTMQLDTPSLDEEEIQEVSKFIRLHGDVDSIDIRLERHLDDDGEMNRLLLNVWGEHLDAPELAADLQAEYPFLTEAEITAEPLEAAIDTNWGGLALRRIVPGELSSDKQRAREQILPRLQADGIEGDVHVEVFDGPEGRSIRVEVRQEEIATGEGGPSRL